MIDLLLASQLAKRLEFPADKTAALQTETDKARKAFTVAGENYPWVTLPGEPPRFGCDSVLKYDSYISALRASGVNERAALLRLAR